MELRYLGFDQERNTRFYKFAQNTKGQPTLNLVISVDVGLFFKHRVGIQDGPALCAKKLNADLEANLEGVHELTNGDLLTFASERATRDAERLEARRSGAHRRSPRPAAADAAAHGIPDRRW
jgi:hypothetical protein